MAAVGTTTEAPPAEVPDVSEEAEGEDLHPAEALEPAGQFQPAEALEPAEALQPAEQFEPVEAFQAAERSQPAEAFQPVAVPPAGATAYEPAGDGAAPAGHVEETHNGSRALTSDGAMRTSRAWTIALDDGRSIDVEGPLLLGRNPQPQPGEENAQLVTLADETRTVSKSHLAIGVDAAGLYVVDRGSTNGSVITTPEGASARCRPGEVIHTAPGSIVSIGDHWLEVRRGEG